MAENKQELTSELNFYMVALLAGSCYIPREVVIKVWSSLCLPVYLIVNQPIEKLYREHLTNHTSA